MHLQMSEFAGKYNGMQPKKKAPRKSFVEKASLLDKYPDNKLRFVRDTLYTEYRTGIRDRKNRALKLLQENEVELKGAPDWVEKVGKIINTAKYTILGGGLKDIILWKDYAYTFHIVPNEEDPETNWKSKNQKRYEDHLDDLAKIFAKLHPKTRARLNYAAADNIYATTFKMKENTKVDRRLIITRVALCTQGTLMDYIIRWKKTLGVEAFATMVYETMKVLRILHDNSVYVLDIKPDNIFVCDDPREKGYDGYTFSFGDLDMAEICSDLFDEKVGYKACQSDLATLFFLPTNAIENINDQRNLYGHQGYTIRDAYALSKTLLITFNMIYKPYDIAIFDENKLFDWWQPQTRREQKEWAKDEDLKQKTQGRRYITYMTQGMSNYEWENKMEKSKKKLIKLAKEKAPKLTPVIEALFLLMYQTSNSGRPVELNNNPTRLQNWDEMVQIDRIHELMEIAKDRARKAGATTFKRAGWFGFSELEEEDVTQAQLKF